MGTGRDRALLRRAPLAQSSMPHVRVDDGLKAKATETLARIGLTVSDAAQIILTRVAKGGWVACWTAKDHTRVNGLIRHMASIARTPSLDRGMTCVRSCPACGTRDRDHRGGSYDWDDD